MIGTINALHGAIGQGHLRDLSKMAILLAQIYLAMKVVKMTIDTSKIPEEHIKDLILSNCSYEFENSAVVIANVMSDLFDKRITIGDIYLEGVLRKMIEDKVIKSDSKGPYGFYSVAR